MKWNRVIFEQLRTNHRPDIDGLRAVAVIPVLLFHAGLWGFSGGFLGVDVFFVISGFLITSILLREAQEGRFSIAAFYYRRVRRIFPALFVMLLVVTAAAAFILAPLAFRSYANTVVATALFCSNILFWLQSGYFDTSSLEKPLLHTWSLAVEEQFYLIWPLLLSAFFRFRCQRYLFSFLCVGVAVSFTLAAVWGHPTAVFFLPFTRAWELGLGAIIATTPIRLPGWASVPAIAAVLGAIFFCSDETPLFIASGIACIGTAILICTEGGIANELLSLAPCVGIGLISYSLYLWHWPLLAFASYIWNDDPPVALRLGLLLSSGVLAYLSWKYVEVPLRKGLSRPVAFRLSGVAIAAAVASGLLIHVENGFPLRYGPEVARLEPQLAKLRSCNRCGFGQPSVVLWGDSFGMAARPAVEDYARRRGLGEIAFLRSGCPPLFGAWKAGDDGCERFQARIQEQLKAVDPKLIMLVSRWSLASETTRFGDAGKTAFLVDATSHEKSVANSRRALSDGLVRTIQTLGAMHPHAAILLVGQAPELGSDADRCLIANVKGEGCETVPSSAIERLAYSNALISKVARKFSNVEPVYLSKALCRSQCPTRIGNIFIYRDPDHLTDAAAKLLLEPQMFRLASERRIP